MVAGNRFYLTSLTHPVLGIIFVTGGVVSGLGKGIVAASIGKILQARGYDISMVKLDPYLNPDPGTMNPVEHGEIFVTEDVWIFSPSESVSFQIAEIDEDFGHYERFLGKYMHPSNNITSGQVMLQVILGERRGVYLGQTVRLIPHVVDEIKRRIIEVAKRENPDFLIVELGGTIGDYEAESFVEALRQIRAERKSLHVHVTYVPYLRSTGELKTKPAQTFIRLANAAGLPPDAIVVRSDRDLGIDVLRKISLYSGVPLDSIFPDPDRENVYEVPLILEEKGLGRRIEKFFGLEERKAELDSWREAIREGEKELTVGIVSKYWRMHDVHISINEAVKHAASAINCRAKIKMVDASSPDLDGLDGVILAPGFGVKGTEGMIDAAKRAMEEKIPTLGICFGAQLSTVAFARHIMGWDGANSTELDPDTPYPVVDMLPEQVGVKEKGGTMRLGAHEVLIIPGTRLMNAYGESIVKERFRHRYHISRKYAELMEERGYKISAVDRTGRIINAFEISWHPFFVGVQFHPEYKSRPGKPSPVYLAFMKSVLEHS